MSSDILEVRLSGRGGQGVVTAGELLGRAVLAEGRWAQSVPTFGPERRGAPATCTLRVSDAEILLKFSAATPSVLLVFDPTIWHLVDVTAGLTEGSTLVFNTPRSPEEVESDLRVGRYGYRLAAEHADVVTVDATGIALEILGRPIPNTAVMGALTGTTDLVQLETIESVLRERFGKHADANVRAARAGLERLRRREGDRNGT